MKTLNLKSPFFAQTTSLSFQADPLFRFRLLISKLIKLELSIKMPFSLENERLGINRQERPRVFMLPPDFVSVKYYSHVKRLFLETFGADSGVSFSMILPQVDKYGLTYFSYVFSKKRKDKNGVLAYLKNFALPLRDPEISDYAISKVWKKVENDVLIDIEYDPDLQPVSMASYEKLKPSEKNIDFRKELKTHKNYRKAEAIMVDEMMQGQDPSSTYFRSIPILIPAGKHQLFGGMIYAIFDKSKNDERSLQEGFMHIAKEAIEIAKLSRG